MRNNQDDQIRKILQSLPQKFAVVKEGITLATQQDYLAFVDRTDLYPFEEDATSLYQVLMKPDTSADAKKKALVVLAHIGTLETYRIIEQFLDTAPKQPLQEWGILALEDCRVHLESCLDENIGRLITGLGGEFDRLRYFFVIRSKDSVPFTGAQQAIVEPAFSGVCHSFNAILEEIQLYQEYATLKVLVPLDVAVAAVIEGGLDECNIIENFLDDGYYVTNNKIPTEAEIQYYLREW